MSHREHCENIRRHAGELIAQGIGWTARKILAELAFLETIMATEANVINALLAERTKLLANQKDDADVTAEQAAITALGLGPDGLPVAPPAAPADPTPTPPTT